MRVLLLLLALPSAAALAGPKLLRRLGPVWEEAPAPSRRCDDVVVLEQKFQKSFQKKERRGEGSSLRGGDGDPARWGPER